MNTKNKHADMTIPQLRQAVTDAVAKGLLPKKGNYPSELKSKGRRALEDRLIWIAKQAKKAQFKQMVGRGIRPEPVRTPSTARQIAPSDHPLVKALITESDRQLTLASEWKHSAPVNPLAAEMCERAGWAHHFSAAYLRVLLSGQLTVQPEQFGAPRIERPFATPPDFSGEVEEDISHTPLGKAFMAATTHRERPPGGKSSPVGKYATPSEAHAAGDLKAYFVMTGIDLTPERQYSK